MAKAKARRKSNGKAKPSPRKPRTKVAAMYGVMADPRVRAWDQLLRDPCAAPLAHPCYTGVDSGYLVRTVDFVTPSYSGSGLTPGNVVVDSIFQFTPFNYSATTGVVSVTAVGGGSLGTTAGTGFATNFINTNTVARYRPVAMCVRWIPTGAYSNRAGLVASGYTTGMVVTAPTFSGNIGTITAEVQKQAPNGSEMHEVRWLPTAVDENFTNTVAATNTGAGSIVFALRGVDGTQIATGGTANGFFQITTAWEWVPAGTTGLSVAPRPPLPYTSQQVLGTIKDFGSFIYHGIRTANELMSASRGGMQLLSGGYGTIERRGQSVPMIRL